MAMARSLSRSIFRCTSVNHLLAPNKKHGAFRMVPIRNQSSQSGNPSLPGVDVNNNNNNNNVSDAESLSVQRIEDAIHRIIVHRSAPDWLPFRPGSSYWVPPRRQSYGIAVLVEKLANSLTNEEVMSLTTARGWPSSSFFVDDPSPNSAEAETTSTSAPQSRSHDEEEE